MFDSKQLHVDNDVVSGNVVTALSSWAEKYGRKNKNYGNSWLLTGETLSLWFPDGICLNSVKKQIMHGLVTRMLDKLIRATHIELANVEDMVGEDSSETFFDLGVYAFMAGCASFIGRLGEFRDRLDGQANKG